MKTLRTLSYQRFPLIKAFHSRHRQNTQAHPRSGLHPALHNVSPNIFADGSVRVHRDDSIRSESFVPDRPGALHAPLRDWRVPKRLQAISVSSVSEARKTDPREQKLTNATCRNVAQGPERPHLLGEEQPLGRLRETRNRSGSQDVRPRLPEASGLLLRLLAAEHPTLHERNVRA